MTMKKPDTSAPEMNRLSPVITQSSPSLTARVARAEGSDPAPGWGSVIAKLERMSPAASGRRYRSFCAGVPMRASMCMLPSSGAMQLSTAGPIGE